MAKRKASQADRGSAIAPDEPAAAGAAPEPGFEAALERLEGIVDRLEGGEIELEQAIASFEEGARLARRCSEQLAAAERRISVLMEEGGAWVARAFEGSAASSGEAGEQSDEERD